MAAVGPAVTGGPVGGGGMMMMGGVDGGVAMQSTAGSDEIKTRLNTYIYEYFLKLGLHDVARALNSQSQDKFKFDSKPKQSPGRRKDGEANGVDSDAMDVDKFDVPNDLPLPGGVDMNAQGEGFLVEWFSIFSDLFTAAAKPKQANMNSAATQYLMHAQTMQRMREGQQQNPGVMRPGMMNNQYAMRANMQRNGMVNGAAMANAEMAKRMTPQQLHMAQQKQQMQAQQQQQMQREGGEVDMNGRPGTPTEGDNGGSPSKRPRLEGQQFQGNMMANGRPMQGGVPQGMMIQNSFNPQQMNPQFRPNGAMPQQKPGMPPGMPNGMMNMNNAGSPMMVGMNNGQFGNDAAMEMYNTGRMGGGQMPGGPGAAQSGNHALQDYQMQLMLLEQQNKKRLMMARQEQDNQVNRDGAPMPGMGGTGMSPSGSRSGTSPNPTDQMKRTPQLTGLPGSPSAGENMQGRSPAGMNFMNGAMPGGEFGNPMFMGDKQGMAGPGGPGMRPPTSMQNMQGRMPNQFQGGQPMAQNPSQGAPMGTPGQRNEMPPPQAPAGGAQRTASSPAQSGGNAPPTPSQTNKANPKNKKGKEDAAANAGANKKKPTKKNSQANTSNDSQTTPAATTSVPPAAQQMPAAPPVMQQPDLSQNSFPDFNAGDQNFNLDFSTLDNTDVLENFDFDSFLNTSTDDGFTFDGGMVGGDFLDAGGD